MLATLLLALAGAAAFLPVAQAQWLVVPGGAVAAAVAGWPAATRRRGARGGVRVSPMGLVSVGLWLTVLGETMHALGAGYPSRADAVELAAYPLVIAGLLRLVHVRLRERPLDTLLVAAITPTALAAFGWLPLVSALGRWVPGARTAAGPTVAFLAADALAVAMLARLTVALRGRPASYQLLLGSFAALLGAHVSRAAGTVTHVVPAPFGSQTLLLVAFSALVAAARRPSLRTTAPAALARPARIGRGHVLVLALAVVIGPLAAVLRYSSRGDWVVVAVGAPAVISLLVVSHLARLVRDRTRLEHASTHDPLTGLPNRVQFTEEVLHALGGAASRPFAIGFLDVDRFKKINDSLGHDAGDELLRQVAERLQQQVRDGDGVGRLAGDEFGVLLRDVDGAADASALAHRLLAALSPAFTVAGRTAHVTASIGVSLAPHQADDPEGLLRSADLAMYEAKSCGGNTVVLYDASMGVDSRHHVAVQTRLHAGIDAGELSVHYQPKVSLVTGEVTGVEALVRWQHPVIGLVPPGAFMPLAEETGLVASIAEYVLQAACQQVQTWRATTDRDLTVSVNLSHRQFQVHDVVSVVAKALESSGLPPSALELELTESGLSEPHVLVPTLEKLRRLGVRCSIDDFGTGYTGIAYLNALPVDKVKLDRSFVNEIRDHASEAPLVRAIIAMARSLGLEIIAEGVETPEQMRFLREQGCDTMQGFLFSQPLPAEDFEDLLRSPWAAVDLKMPRLRPRSTGYGPATDARTLGDLVWREEQARSAAPADAVEAARPVLGATLARRTLVLTSTAGVLGMVLLMGLGSADALPPDVQRALAAALSQVGATSAVPAAPLTGPVSAPTIAATGTPHPHSSVPTADAAAPHGDLATLPPGGGRPDPVPQPTATLDVPPGAGTPGTAPTGVPVPGAGSALAAPPQHTVGKSTTAPAKSATGTSHKPTGVGRGSAGNPAAGGNGHGAAGGSGRPGTAGGSGRPGTAGGSTARPTSPPADTVHPTPSPSTATGSPAPGSTPGAAPSTAPTSGAAPTTGTTPPTGATPTSDATPTTGKKSTPGTAPPTGTAPTTGASPTTGKTSTPGTP